MAITSPDRIYSPSGDSEFNLVSDLATMAQSVQTAISRRGGAQLGTKAERLALTGVTNGMMWTDTDNAMTYQYRSGKWYPEFEIVAPVAAGMQKVDAFKKVRDGGFIVSNFGRTASLSVRLQQVHKFDWAKGSMRKGLPGAYVIPERLRPAYPFSFTTTAWTKQSGTATIDIWLFPSGLIRFRADRRFRDMETAANHFMEIQSPQWLTAAAVGKATWSSK